MSWNGSAKRLLDQFLTEPLGGLALIVALLSAIPPLVGLYKSNALAFSFSCDPVHPYSEATVISGAIYYSIVVFPKCDFSSLDETAITIKHVHSIVPSLDRVNKETLKMLGEEASLSPSDLFLAPEISDVAREKMDFIYDQTPFTVMPGSAVIFHHYAYLPAGRGWAARHGCDVVDDGKLHSLISLKQCNPAAVSRAIQSGEGEHPRAIRIILANDQAVVRPVQFAFFEFLDWQATRKNSLRSGLPDALDQQ